jgi:hypothetical protein
MTTNAMQNNIIIYITIIIVKMIQKMGLGWNLFTNNMNKNEPFDSSLPENLFDEVPIGASK